MTPSRMAALGLVGIAAAGAGLWASLSLNGSDRFAQCSRSTVAGAEIGGPFTLVSETGETVTDAEVLAQPSLLYFGYTFCPDVCPIDTNRNAEATYLLDERGIEVQPVFISVDPGRDTPDVLRGYTDFFHPRMLGLSGSPDQVRAAAQAYKVYYQLGDTADPDYLVDHTTMTYLMLPGHGFVQFFRREAPPEEVANTVACFIAAM